MKPSEPTVISGLPSGPPLGSRLAQWVATLVIGLAAIRLVFAAITELIPEEAYYWLYSQHPAGGYFDHPPMVAWLAGAGTFLLGDTQLGVRLFTILLGAASAWLLYLFAREWTGPRPALVAVLTYALVPLFAGVAYIATPDQGLLFFWIAALLCYSRAVRRNGWGWWLGGGLAFGGALLSKYYGLMLGPSLLLFLLASPPRRAWLWRPHPWVSFLVALAVFSPAIIWNAQHEWASFLFQAGRTSGGESHALRDFAVFWGVQAIVLTPLVFVWLGVAVARGISAWKRHDEAWTFALSFSLPLFLVFAAASLKTEVHVNWTAPAFLSLLPCAAALFLPKWDDGGRGWKIAAVGTSAVCLVVFAVALAGLAWGTPRIYEFLDRGTAQGQVNEHLAGERNRRLFIWSLLSVEHWLQGTYA